MTSQPLPSASPGKTATGRPRPLVLLVSGASALFAGFAVGYALGTVHAYERRLRHKGHHGV